MNYLTVPDSKLKLVDGNIVMLERFPGLKWVLHNGWYTYNDRQYMGWYFSSIPSQTILPVSNQDLRMIVLVSSNSNQYPDCPPIPLGPHEHHGHHGHCPPVYPPVVPDPEPEKPAFFSRTCKNQLDAAFISVPTLKKRDQLDTSAMPDGKIVRVNSVEGEPKYYAWSAFNDHWEELTIVSNSDIEEYLSNYYTCTQINEYIELLNERVSTLQASVDSSLSEVSSQMTQLEESTSSRLNEVNQELQGLHGDIEQLQRELDQQSEAHGAAYLELADRVSALESAVFNIQRLPSISESNTVLVSSNGTLKDSGDSLEDIKPKWNLF